MKLFTNSEDVNTEIGLVERVSYGMGNFANALVFMLIMSYLTFYYTDVVGLNAGIIGSIMLASRVFDGITDLAVGYLIDHSKQTKFGKVRGWYIKSVIPFAITAVIVFAVPQNASDVLKYVFVFISYNVCNAIFYTMVAVSYNTLLIKLTHNSMQRGICGIFVMIGSSAGGLIVTSSCLKLVNHFGGDARAWTITVAIYTAIGLVAQIICVTGSHERIRDEAVGGNGNASQEKIGFVESVKYLLKNKYWLMVVGAFSIYWICYALNSAGTIYYAQYILGNRDFQPGIANAQQISVLTAMLTAFFPMRFLGKANAVRTGFSITTISYILQLLIGGTYTGLVICTILKAYGWGIACAVISGMNPDALDYGTWKYGKNISGTGVAAVSFGQKIGTGLGSAIFGLFLNMGGYDGTAATQTASALRAINISFSWIPLVLMILCVVCMLGYNLDKKLPQIQEDLKNGRTAADEK